MSDQFSPSDNELLLKTLRIALSGDDQAVEAVRRRISASTVKLFAEQKLMPIVVDVVRDADAAENWPQFADFKRAARIEVMRQAQRGLEFLEVYGKLKEAEIDALVVKGCVCRSIWPKGGLRISTDEDLYVREDDFCKACEILREFGLNSLGANDAEDAFEIGWRSPSSTLFIELHKRLFAPGSGATVNLQRYFDDAFDRAREYEVEFGAAKVLSMSAQDHLLYLILHAYKHFIRSGFGIRQVCDIGLWAKRYTGEIDHLKLMRDLEQSHALYFAAAVFAIAREDLGIELRLPDRWADLAVDRAPMLRDLLDAGVYGNSSMSRQHSAPMTLEAVAAKREQRKKTGLLQRAFPPKESMLLDYPELKEQPARLPIAWLKRLAKYRKETKTMQNNSTAESLRIAKEREELLRCYHII